ncbi:MFS general substrate transporter [Patellaria atrata CBS 101060]|uniref:MFS general substrate transporter n=1 Tax=Patellaria atrata CBS 101060 TaxID=1346257 RepID=A0A9P4SCP4_9PEZI|nr:MFS general substrate transporter [Patellaria atrata CBS 101060]
MSYRPRRSSYYHIHEPPAGPRRRKTGFADQSRRSSGTDRRLTQAASTAYLNSLDPTLSGLSLKHPRRNHHSLKGRASRGFSLGRSSRRRQPIARNWNTGRKRIVATIACVNTGLMGFIIGVYAGEVPRIQYQLADQSHQVILGNVVLYLGLAITTFIFWPLPLLHGRKPYILLALGLALPLQFPQAVIVDSPRSPKDRQYIAGLLLSRAVTGLILGFANINFLPTLFDLFGASLQSSKPHQEIVYVHDIRRHGGGMGMWLGIWTWCFIGMLAIGFCTGAGIIADLNPSWGFYIVVIVTAFVLFLNVVTPETRREHWRKSVAEFVDEDDEIKKRVARGEVKLHISMDGPKWWHEEVSAGVMLSFRMLFQRGFFLLALYLGWIYAQVVLVIVLLGALLSREYRMQPQYVGLGVFSLAIGALLATPLSKAGIFSRARKEGPRTDSMTFQERITWTSHLARRLIFMILLPFAGFVYTMVSWGRRIPFIVPCVFAGVIGFLSNLAIAECYGLVMETFDTSDLQPGVNSRHRLQSLAEDVRRRRTNYSSFPRVISGIFVSQSFAFLLAAAATGVGGALTRRLGAQAATGVTAGVLLFLTIGLTLALWRFKEVQVIPNHAFGTRRNTVAQEKFELEDWKPVVIGNPSGKMRRVNVLELGRLSRWTEIRRLNRLLRDGDEGF